MGGRPEVMQSRALAAKLALLILFAAALGVSLLSARQRRLAAAHDLAVLHARAEEDGRTALRLRQEIADRVALPRIRATAVTAGLKEPLLPFESPENAPHDRPNSIDEDAPIEGLAD